MLPAVASEVFRRFTLASLDKIQQHEAKEKEQSGKNAEVKKKERSNLH